MAGKVIGQMTPKGGVGKTTSAITLATYLASKGKKVVFADLDPEMNGTLCAGLGKEADQGMANLFIDDELRPQDIVIRTSFSKPKYNIDILRSTRQLEGVLNALGGQDVGILKAITEELKKDYDYVILDFQPSFTTLVASGFMAMDYLLIPLQLHYLAFESLTELFKKIAKARRGVNPGLQVLGIAPMMHDTRTNHTKLIYQNIIRDYPKYLIPDVLVPFATEFANASLRGEPLCVTHPKHLGSQEYAKLGDYVISVVEGANVA